MATTPPQAGFFRDGQSCLPWLHDRDGDQSTRAPSFQRRSQQLDHSEMKETEGLLAVGMNNLSVKERSEALNDVHCVGEMVKETPQMIEQSLREFDQTVAQTTAEPIYNVAVDQNRSYVEDSEFRLKFLRANTFNARKSVNQMMNFLRQKALYFGEDKVAQDIVPEDMNTEEIAFMRSGAFQILKDRDPSGRVILYHSPFRALKQIMHIDGDKRKLKTFIHVLYHLIFNVLIEMQDVQRKGIVMIVYDEESNNKGDDHVRYPGPYFQMKVTEFWNSLPFRILSLHLCFHSSSEKLPLFNKMLQAGLKAGLEHVLSRTRLQYGSNMERQYELRSFGIPLDNFPIDKNCNIRNEA